MSSLATTEAVLQLMKTDNRPCSVNCLIQKDTSKLGKSSIQKALDTLVREGKVTLKEYGKQKIYAVKQVTTAEPDVENAAMRTLDIDIAAAQQKLKEQSTQLKSLQDQLQQKTIKRSCSTLRTENSQVFKQIADVTIKIGLKNDRNRNGEETSVAEKKEIERKYEKYLAVYKKRKNLCKEMIETIMEGYPGTKKKLEKDIGFETDEDVGFVFVPQKSTSFLH